ncbi:MAG: kinase, partial [Spirochaetes bacterium]
MINNYVALIGAANIDIQGFSSNLIIARDSNPGSIEFCAGGVSRNIAENLSRLGVSTELISAIGGDPNGELILSSCRDCG